MVYNFFVLYYVFVNCIELYLGKLKLDKNNIILGVIELIGIQFLFIVVVYLKFEYDLKYINGIVNNVMISSFVMYVVNIFLICYN